MDANLSKRVVQEALPALLPSCRSASDRGAPPPSFQLDSLPAEPQPPPAFEPSAAAQPEPPLSPPVFTPAEANAFALTGEAAPARLADNQGEACDRAVLDELRAEGGTLLTELAGIFQAEMATALSQLACALEAHDCATTARIAHTLKSSAGIFGAAYMQELAARIDHAACAGRSDQAAAMYGEFHAECARVRHCVAAAITV